MIKFNFYTTWSLIMFMVSLLSFYMMLNFCYYDYSIMIEWEVFNLNSFSVFYLLIFDWISMCFISVVTLISSMVILYSIDYMGVSSYSTNRFLFLVILFIVSMILMIMSPNLLSILLGWDGLGLVSYCLVIYYNSMKSYLAGMITCLTNRLGDIGLLISISWMVSFGSWHFMFYLDFYSSYLFWMVILSSFTKSAQIPFSSWLPAAMAAPTPVSSLVHSSTLVTAGVYLLIRFFNKLNFNNMYFLFLSMMTMLMSSFCASYEFDLKKIIALSTLSQLGLMMTSLFLGLVNLSFFHLISHAMFKSLLFLCAGIFIYHMNDNQDIRCMSCVSSLMPFTTSCFNISNMALCGIPFLSGFYSKDLIVELSMFGSYNYLVFILLYFCLGLTTCYSVRLFYYSMIFNIKLNSMVLFNDDYKLMKVSIAVLSFMSVSFGCMMMWLINLDMVYLELPFFLKLFSIICVMSGVWFGAELTMNMNFMMSMNYYMFGNMWMMFSYSYYIYMISYNFSYNYINQLNWGEFYGSMGLSFYLLKFSNSIQYYMFNNMKLFLISFFIWFMMIM
nr:NADH dehydrogenase subunit 5 [Shaddai sp. SL-2021a]